MHKFIVLISLQGLVEQLVDYNLRRGNPAVRSDVRQLICLLTRDNLAATDELNNILMNRISLALRGHHSNPDLVSRRIDVCWLRSRKKKLDEENIKKY